MLVEVLEVRVPVLSLLAEIEDVDERHASLDQAPGHQKILAAHLAGVAHLGPVAAAAPFAFGQWGGSVAVTVARRGRFLRQVEGPPQRFGAQELKCLVAQHLPLPA